MTAPSKLFSVGFVLINIQFALVTTVAALFFVFSGYLNQLGVTSATAGFILGADGLAALIVLPLVTTLIQASTARRWLFGGSLLFSSALFMIGHITDIPLLIVARLLQGSGFITVLASLMTMVVPLIPSGMSGRAFCYLSFVRLIPYAIIPLVFNLVAVTPSSFVFLLNVAAVLALLPLFMFLFPKKLDTAPQTSHGIPGMGASLGDRKVILLLLSTLLVFCGYSAIFYYLKQYGLSAGIANANLFFSIATLVMIAIRLFGGWLFDRYNKAWFSAMGLLAVAVCYGGLPWCRDIRLFFMLAAFIGFGWGIAMPLQAAAMFDISTPSTRAVNQNLLLVMMQGGFFLGPLLGGQIIARYGYTALFTSIAITGVASAVMMACIKIPLSPESRIKRTH